MPRASLGFFRASRRLAVAKPGISDLRPSGREVISKVRSFYCYLKLKIQTLSLEPHSIEIERPQPTGN